MRRPFKTRDSITVELVRLTISSPYFGAIEISRMETATRFILGRAVEQGELVVGVDLHNIPRQLPAEELVFELHSNWLPRVVEDPYDYRTERVLRCYQQGGDDPFATLATVIAELEWSAVSKLVRWA